jgi:DNA repair protein SbcC/Rad50
MRLHQLTVSAFGPFAGTHVVDFDELNDAGLFLLTGPTGAGKSSLLDAVCFALYGSVPGARGVKTLKSQHAAAHIVPEVVLDFSVRGRRFVVRRSPEWSRPKKRGDGLLTEKASASIIETTNGVETFLSSRAAEVGLLLNDLMGMTAGQFVQVALLPQGEFQTFLRASSQERHDVLQRLFRTDRFARIEDWVHEHSRDLQQRAAGDRAVVQRLVDSIAERCGNDTPEALCGDALVSSAVEGHVLSWAGRCAEQARGSLDAARAAHRVADERRTRAAQAHETALRVGELTARREEAVRTLERLASTSDDADSARAALALTAKAERCLPLLTLLDEALAVARTADAERETVLAGVAVAPADPSTETLAAAVEEIQAQATRLEALLPREAAAAKARRDLVDLRARLAVAEAHVDELTGRAEQLPVEVAALDRALRETTARSARGDAARLSLEAARRRLDAATALPAAEAELMRLADAHRDARDRALTAREHRNELTSRRLAGIAAELADRLVDGEPCEVCGSTAHPRPTLAAVDHISEADQELAEQAVSAAAEQVDTTAAALQQAGHRRDTLAEAADGRTAAAAGAEVAQHREMLADAEASARALPGLQDRLAALRAEQDAVAVRISTATKELAALGTTAAVLEQTVEEVTREIAEMTGGAAVAALRPMVEGLRRDAVALRRALDAVESADRATARVAELEQHAAGAVTEHGFSSVEAVRAALLTPEDQRRLTEQLTERDRTASRAEEVLEETAALADGVETAAVPTLAAALAAAETEAAETARRFHAAEEQVDALESLTGRLDAALATWAPLRDTAIRAEGMSRLVRGMGHDNQLQMRLSAYVLATRLDQVVAAANERLGHLRDQRYLLQRTDRAARKGSQAGLGLEVVDQWTGDARSPATLSGGETFVVSLSLALGLADVVTQEAGGVEVDTLFVDEGFGTLDADTLDDVMDRLDGLRAGGRTVGVVSHVSELRNRIPTQVHVHKGRSGSSITVTTLVG